MCFTYLSYQISGLMDDLAGFSCSDSEEDWLDDDATDSDSAGPAGNIHDLDIRNREENYKQLQFCFSVRIRHTF